MPPGHSGHLHVFHDGEWTDRSRAAVPIGSLAMRYGLSVFEGIRLYKQRSGTGVAAFLLGAHLQRLANSLSLMQLPDPGIDKLPAIIDDLVLRNNVDDDAYVRIAVTPTNPGQLDDEAVPVMTVTTTPMGRKRWLAHDEGMHLQVSLWQRADDLAFPSAAKNISSYAGPRLAALDAKSAGYDGCVLTNRAGRLCEAPTAAVFVARDGVLHTPALDEGVLPSITRQWVLSTAPSLDITAEVGQVPRPAAYLADEAFLCGTGIEFGPIRAFDAHACRGWPDNPLTRKLIRRYFDEARELPR